MGLDSSVSGINMALKNSYQESSTMIYGIDYDKPKK